MTSIRTADSRDAGAIAAVHVASWRTTYAGIVPSAFLDSLNVEDRTRRWEEIFATQDSLFFVAEDEAGIFGFVNGGMIRQPIAGYDAELYALYLLRERQGQGAGRALFRSLAGALVSQNLSSMVVWVLAQNPTVGFYRRMGGIQVAEQKIEIAGVELEELAFGWESLRDVRPSKREFVAAALDEYTRRRKQAKILRWFGTIDYDEKYDYKKNRRQDRVDDEG